MNIKFRSVTEDDLPQFKAFLDEHNMLSDSDYERLRIFLHKNPLLSKMAYLDDKIVGGVLCSYDGLRGHLLKLVVEEEYRKQGIGKKLIAEVIMELEKLGCPEVTINCRPFLQNWYASQGFEKLDYMFYIKYLNSDHKDQSC
ncbi:MAG TPA: GNAT family N-acetyltransferase [Candidatus Dojkabacteria bacterium]|jgi:ribosomal protein S18 acetylase RimI-like enzyme|nr:GNAT family N-acetyltransferase [Candidatus Dojkabacteria bacterium]